MLSVEEWVSTAGYRLNIGLPIIVDRLLSRSGLSEAFVANDLTVVGSLAGGGDLGAVDLIYVPEPATALLSVIAMILVCSLRNRGKSVRITGTW